MRVARDYTPQYPDPITVRAGDRVQVGRDDPEWPGWRWCTGPDGRAGWVPEQLIQSDGVAAIMLRDYTARELRVQAGMEVGVGESMNGWVWATDAEGHPGWIPESYLGPG